MKKVKITYITLPVDHEFRVEESLESEFSPLEECHIYCLPDEFIITEKKLLEWQERGLVTLEFSEE